MALRTLERQTREFPVSAGSVKFRRLFVYSTAYPVLARVRPPVLAGSPLCSELHGRPNCSYRKFVGSCVGAIALCRIEEASRGRVCSLC